MCVCLRVGGGGRVRGCKCACWNIDVASYVCYVGVSLRFYVNYMDETAQIQRSSSKLVVVVAKHAQKVTLWVRGVSSSDETSQIQLQQSKQKKVTLLDSVSLLCESPH